MDGPLFLGLISLVVGAFAFASLRWGVDSREFSTDPRSPARPVGIS